MAHDLIIIGGGTAGIGASRAALTLGAKPVLVSDGPVGGDCTFTGCIPSKTLIAESRRGSSFSDAIARVHKTIDEVAATETADILRAEGVDVVEGRALIAAPGRVEVEGRTLTSEHIVIATGSGPVEPPIHGLKDIEFLTNESLFDLSDLPPRLGIMGGGAIGCEIAMAFAGFGSAVTIFEAADRLLPNEEPEASDVIDRAMTSLGVGLVLGEHVSGVERVGAGVSVLIEDRVFEVDELLVATGRSAITKGLGLEDLGVEFDGIGNIVVDDRLKTTVKGISAAGDVTGLLPFTHAAYEQGRLAVSHALGKGTRWRYSKAVTPWVTFTRPEVARLGLTEDQAAHVGGRVAHLPLTKVDRAITEGRTDGFVKLIAGPKTLTRRLFGGQIIGATIVADRAGEMIHGPALAARTGMFVGRLAQTTTAYPTWTMAVQQAAGQFFEEMNGLSARPAKRHGG